MQISQQLFSSLAPKFYKNTHVSRVSEDEPVIRSAKLMMTATSSAPLSLITYSNKSNRFLTLASSILKSPKHFTDRKSIALSEMEKP
jgi:hypothetical protein